MPLTNPAAIIHQNLLKAMQEKQPSSPQVKKSGLLAPTKQAVMTKENDANNPINRIATYVDTVRKKREELKENGT